MKRRSLGLAFVVLLQVMFLASWAGYHEWLRYASPVVRLRVLPVDPRDILRGQYFTLSYEIGQIERDVAGGLTYAAGTELWVALGRADEFWLVRGVSRERPELAGPTERAVRGTVASSSASGQLWLRFGIEQYFVPEGSPTPDTARLVVEATVSPEGRLNIKRVLLDGRPFP